MDSGVGVAMEQGQDEDEQERKNGRGGYKDESLVLQHCNEITVSQSLCLRVQY